MFLSRQNSRYSSFLGEDIFFAFVGGGTGLYGLGIWLLPQLGLLTTFEMVAACVIAGVATSLRVVAESCH